MTSLPTISPQRRVLVVLSAVMVLASACATASPAAEPTAEATSEAAAEATPEATPEPTPEPTAEPTPTEAAAACMDPEAYDILFSGLDLTDAERDTLIAALEDYDFSDLTPEARERAETWVENYTAVLTGESAVEPAGLVVELQAGMIPIEACEP